MVFFRAEAFFVGHLPEGNLPLRPVESDIRGDRWSVRCGGRQVALAEEVARETVEFKALEQQKLIGCPNHTINFQATLKQTARFTTLGTIINDFENTLAFQISH